MKLPIILYILDEKMAYIYSDINYLESDLEAIDVQDGLYEVYDSEGKALKLVIFEEDEVELVKIEEDLFNQSDTLKVCAYLLEPLVCRGMIIESKYKRNLTYLIEKYIEYFSSYPLPLSKKEKRLNRLIIIIFLIVIGSIALKNLHYINC